jgi:hypothetical protein
MSVFLAPGDLATYGPTFLAALSSVTVETGIAALPTATAAPVTPTVTPVPAVVLDHTTVTGSGLTVSYPAGWTATELNDVLTLSNVASLEIVDEGDDLNAAPGQFQFTVALQAADGATLAEMLARNAGTFATGEPVEFKAGKLTALAVPIDVGVLSGTLTVAALGDQVVVVTAFHNPADAAEVDALLRAMIAAFDVNR